MAPDQSPVRNIWISLVVLVAAPWLSRVLLLLDAGAAWGIADLRGFVADLAIAMVAVPLVLLAGSLARWVAVVLVLAWNLFHWLNLEVVADLGSLGSVLDVGFLADGTFVIGSATRLSWPLALAILSLGTSIAIWRPSIRGHLRFGLAMLVPAGVLLAMVAFWPVSSEVAEWRQDDFIRANFAYVLRSESRERQSSNDTRAAVVELVPDLVANLEGDPLLPLPGEARNVLLVMVEGVSGAFLPSLAADHGLRDLFAMPELDRIARDHWSFSTFVSHNRKTNRGVFSLLCGEPPNLYPGTPKMTQMAMIGGKTCLPHVLRDSGYDTAFLQAAPLAFMVKDQFAIRAGFERVLGLAAWDSSRAASHNKWGIDDRSLFEQSVEVLEELDRGDKPWFASILTVGTHHPYVFPEETDEKGDGANRRQAAFAYADQAIGDLVDALEDRGILENTLVLITSDESRGVQSLNPGIELPNPAVTRRMSTNWGFLIAIPPEGGSARVKEPFGQLDVALSILDYVGLGDRADTFLGRSVFRHYSEPRIIPFANTNLLRASALDSAGALFDCRIDRADCQKWSVAAGSFFGPEVLEQAWDESNDGWVLDLARRSQAEISTDDSGYEIELLVAKQQTVGQNRLLHGGPYLTLMPGQWLELELEVTASDGEGKVELKHRLSGEGHWGFTESAQKEEATFSRKFVLASGDRLELRYSWFPTGGERLDGIKVETLAEADSESPFELRFHRAVLRVHQGEPRPSDGFQLQVEEITR